MATAVATIDKQALKGKSRATLAYRALLVFSFLYYTRPEDVIPGLNAIPIGKISGGIALIALIAGLAGSKVKTKLPLEIKVLLILFAHLILTIPFAFWRGGAFATVFEKFSKAVIVALLVALIVQTFQQLRTLLFVQAAAVAIMVWISLIVHPGGGTRLEGVLGGIFENPNDLAINLAINWPLGLAFLFAARGAIKKGLWMVGLVGMLYGVVATYSRSGSLAMAVSLLVCLWEFGIRGKRFHLLALAGILGIVGLGVGVATPHYMARMKSIFQGNIEDSGDRGSWEARRELLRLSLQLTIQHPLFGVGPGNFGAETETWRVTHNTYTQFSAEAGLPALMLFLLILFLAFRNLRRVRKMARYRENKEIQLFTSALWASLAAYLVGAAFASTEYTLFPYFMVAYTTALYRIASEPIQTASGSRPGEAIEGDSQSDKRGGVTKRPEFAWNR